MKHPLPSLRSGFTPKILLCLFLFLAAVSVPAAADSRAAASETVVRSAAEVDYPPFSIVDESGRAYGFSVELLRAALSAMNREVTFRTGPWHEVRTWLEKGEVDALPLVGRTPERELLFDFTFPYMSLYGAIVTRQGTVGIKRLEDLKGLQVAVMQGDNAEEFLRREDRGLDIISRPTFEIALRELADGRYDAVFIQRLVALRLIRESGINGLEITRHPIEAFRQDFCFAVKEGDRDTLALLNEGLALVMADGTFRRLHARWFAALQLPVDRPVIIGGDHNYPPFEFIDPDGKPAGFMVDLTRAIAREMNMDIQIRLAPWTDTVQALETGEIDAVQGMFYSGERDRTLDFSPHHMVSHYVSVVAEDRSPPETVAELAGLNLVVQQGDIILEYLAEHDLMSRVTVLKNQEDVLLSVTEKRFDCALAPRISALYMIREKGWRLNLSRAHFYAGEYSYAVKDDRRALLAQLSEGLEIVEQSGEYRRIQDEWLGMYQEKSLPVTQILRYAAMVLLPLLLILAGMLLWSRALRRQVARKTRELQDSVEFQQAMVACSPVALYSIDFDGNVTAWNESAQNIFGWTAEEVLGRPLPVVPEDRLPEFEELRRRVMTQGPFTGLEVVRRRKDGTLFDASLSAAPIRDSKGTIIGIMGALEDITKEKKQEADREKLQEQLAQAQKMESVGRLAGGVAHDFNNMLNVIIGYAELGQVKTTPDNPLYADFQEILDASRRSSDIIRQLLAFARKQTIQPRVLDLNEVIEGTLKMLRRLIGEDITLYWHPGPELRSVFMDASQVDQVLANLLVNARDAIDGTGHVTIETRNVSVDEEYCTVHSGFTPGDFVMLAVSDDGSGMDRHTRENLFEPFFSTKKQGKGTGLGLATVYGIVKQNNGFIHVYSEPGGGATFKIYLPCHDGPARENGLHQETPVPPARGETLLIVEDEKSILKLAGKILEALGYQVIAVLDPLEALERIAHHDGDIHLLLTDVVMPRMNGRDLAKQVQEKFPDIRVLYMSGYTANVIAHHGILDTSINFIQKPFTNRDLAVKVRAVLDQAGG